MKWGLTLLVLLTSLGAAASEHPTRTELEALRHVAPANKWKLLHVFSLSTPSDHHLGTGHPQGLNISGATLALSTQRKPYGAVLFYRLSRSKDHAIEKLDYISTTEFKKYPGQNHAGGIGRDAANKEIYVPVAAAMFGATSIVELSASGGPRQAEIARFPFHLGAVFVEPNRKTLYAIGRDPGFRFELYGNSLYAVDLNVPPKMVDETFYKFRPPFISLAATGYQDCKFAGGNGYFLCSNVQGSFFNQGGSLDLVHVKADGTYDLGETLRIDCPRVRPDGTLMSGRGLYIPGFVGFAPLSYNGFDFEFSDDGKKLTFYFAPNNEPSTNLYIYDVPFDTRSGALL